MAQKDTRPAPEKTLTEHNSEGPSHMTEEDVTKAFEKAVAAPGSKDARKESTLTQFASQPDGEVDSDDEVPDAEDDSDDEVVEETPLPSQEKSSSQPNVVIDLDNDPAYASPIRGDHSQPRPQGKQATAVSRFTEKDIDSCSDLPDDEKWDGRSLALFMNERLDMHPVPLDAHTNQIAHCAGEIGLSIKKINEDGSYTHMDLIWVSHIVSVQRGRGVEPGFYVAAAEGDKFEIHVTRIKKARSLLKNIGLALDLEVDGKSVLGNIYANFRVDIFHYTENFVGFCRGITFDDGADEGKEVTDNGFVVTKRHLTSPTDTSNSSVSGVDSSIRLTCYRGSIVSKTMDTYEKTVEFENTAKAKATTERDAQKKAVASASSGAMIRGLVQFSVATTTWIITISRSEF